MKEAAIKIATDLHISYDDKLPTSFEQRNYEMKNLKPGKGKKIRESFAKEYQSSIAICVK